MTTFDNKYLLFVTSYEKTFYPHRTFRCTDKMRVVWHGHSCFEIDDGSVTVVVDPHDGKSIGIKPPSVSADYVLVTHEHYDHSAVNAVRGNHKDFVGTTGKCPCGSIEAEGLPSFHDGEDGRRRGRNVIYRIVAEDIVICHCGDLGAAPPQDIIDRMRGCDMLMVPAGEVYTMDIPEIAALIEAVDPKVIIPMHYHASGLSIPLRTLERFTETVRERTTYIGQEMDISKDELPSSRECWIFSR